MKRWAKLARDARYRRSEQRALIEGPHLLASLLDSGRSAEAVMVSESGLASPGIQRLLATVKSEPIVLSDRAFRALADAETPQGIAAEIAIPAARLAEGSCAFLEGIQDAGNVGAIIRSAAAFGIRSLVLDRSCADPWSPKTLRAGMGGHFQLGVASTDDLRAEVQAFQGPVLCTVASGGEPLREARLEGCLGWIFGSEGSGISPGLLALGRKLRIPTAAGTESLNVAAAAAICFYEAFSRAGAGS